MEQLSQFPSAADVPPPSAVFSGHLPPPSHPSYAEMITAAIVWDSSQGKQGGSSKRAIAKYIDRVYTNLPPSHATLLSQHLKQLKNSGYLVMFKNSYQLASSSSSSPNPHNIVPELSHTGSVVQQEQISSFPNPSPGPRRPGRPRKQNITTQALAPFPVHENGPQTGKKRGRPAKLPVQRAVQVEHQIVMEPAEVPFVNQPNTAAIDAVVVQKRRPGRPPKAAAQVGEAAGKRRPGRPKKSSVSGPGPRLGPAKRGRGRPPKMSVVGGVEKVTSGRRQPRRLSGKPLGRPRKDAVNSKRMSEQMANEELMRKLDLIISKVRDVVDVIRPYIAHENEALVALQQLEELLPPSVTAPETDQPVSATPMTVIAPPTVPMPVSYSAAGNFTGPPTESVVAPVNVMNTAAPFSVNLPPMNASAPFQVPSGFENQQRMSWMPSSEAQS